uniref:Disease resistance R13L4/SHOC-2-like LRR domain-containing protein n=1 Tax=Fagus sylvatica TaxID=28930 RepID=A0A2N9IFS3_FAGSY
MVLLWCSAKPKWWVRVTVRIEAELLKRGWFAVEAVTLAWLAIEAVINSVRVVQITIEGLLPVKIPIITTGFMGKWVVLVPAISISSKRGSIKPIKPKALFSAYWPGLGFGPIRNGSRTGLVLIWAMRGARAGSWVNPRWLVLSHAVSRQWWFVHGGVPILESDGPVSRMGSRNRTPPLDHATVDFAMPRTLFLFLFPRIGAILGAFRWNQELSGDQDSRKTTDSSYKPHLYFRLDWFSKMRYVKVLQLGRWSSSATQLVEVEDPEFLQGLKKMKHLRYFSLRGISRITELPNSICKLSNLRILNLNGCDNLEKLPDGIGSLTKLTHLDMSECYLISHMPKGLDMLSELQVLNGFVIGNPRAKGLYCGLADLAKLEHLRKLSIHVDTETPRDKKSEVEKELSSLGQFRKLKSLSVAWSRIYNASTSTKETTMHRLKSRAKSMRTKSIPSAECQSQLAALDKLGLQYFHGPKMPDWLQPLNLKSLKKLYIRGGELSDLRQMGNQSWTVERLQFKFLSELKMDWQELQALFPKLTYVEKANCPNLTFFPCDENGVWVSPAADTKQAIIPL